MVVGAGFVIDSVFLQKTRMALGTGKNIAVTENEREFCTQRNDHVATVHIHVLSTFVIVCRTNAFISFFALYFSHCKPYPASILCGINVSICPSTAVFSLLLWFLLYQTELCVACGFVATMCCDFPI